MLRVSAMLLAALALVEAVSLTGGTTFLAPADTSTGTGSAYERTLPDQSVFLDKSHDTVQHIRADLKEFYKTVGEQRAADLEEAGRFQQNYLAQLHQQEDEVHRLDAGNKQLEDDIAKVHQDIKGLGQKKADLQHDNAELDKQLKDLKVQVEQEVSGLETLLGSGGKTSALSLDSKVAMGSIDEEDADDADDKDDSDDSKDDSKDDDKDDDKDADSKDDDKDDDSDDSKDDKEDAKENKVEDEKDDDGDDDDDKPSVLQIASTQEPCKCQNACSSGDKGTKSFCFVGSATCSVKANCDKGAKGDSCIKVDPKRGAWTLCANIISSSSNSTASEDDALLPENPNVAVAQRMLLSLQKEIADITDEDEAGIEKLKGEYEHQKREEEHARAQVEKRQHALQKDKQRAQDTKAGLRKEVQSLQEANKALHRQVDRFGQFLTTESAKLTDVVNKHA